MILSVMRAGWMNLRRDRAALVLSFVVPIVFFSIFASVFGGKGKGQTSKITLAVADEDQSLHSGNLLDALRGDSALKLVEAPPGKGEMKFNAATAEAFVRAGSAPVALVIPKGFGATKIDFAGSNGTGQPTLLLVADTSDPIASPMVNGLLQKSVMTSMPHMFMQGGVAVVDQFSGGLTPEQHANLDKSFSMLQMSSAAQGKTSGAGSPMVNIKVNDVLGATKKSPMVAFYAAGVGVMFLLFTAANAGGALLEENESGTLDRILTTRLSLTQLLVGKMAYLTTLGVTQLTIMFVWGAVAFGLELFSHLAGFFVMAVATALACSAFGLLIASLSRTRAQLSAITTLCVLTLSAVGGSMFPRFLMSETLQKVGLITFNAWALEGFIKVFWREQSVASLWPEVAVLLATTMVFFVTARKLTRRWEIS
ncbi:MAG TPA: ABC transporter permease [Thermoanaerobaculia bacterium]|nr:ABC transporter permease [Thermoanaerobaculia bacterium]